jgi:hypothetical protein
LYQAQNTKKNPPAARRCFEAPDAVDSEFLFFLWNIKHNGAFVLKKNPLKRSWGMT